MRPRPCSLCGHPADVSVVVVLSTLRIRSRRQQYTKSVPFCAVCFGEFINGFHSPDDPSFVSTFADALTPAWNALTKESDEQSLIAKARSQDSPSQIIGSESTSAVRPNASCRPCVTPCNSRQFDEAKKE